jgi:hypothetical protein
MLTTTIKTTKKILDFKDEAKNNPRNSEEDQGEKKQGKRKDKYKGKMKISRKGNEHNAKEINAPKEKRKLVSCWIYAKEHYVNNCPLKKTLATMEQEDKSYMRVFQDFIGCCFGGII